MGWGNIRPHFICQMCCHAKCEFHSKFNINYCSSTSSLRYIYILPWRKVFDICTAIICIRGYFFNMLLFWIKTAGQRTVWTLIDSKGWKQSQDASLARHWESSVSSDLTVTQPWPRSQWSAHTVAQPLWNPSTWNKLKIKTASTVVFILNTKNEYQEKPWIY